MSRMSELIKLYNKIIEQFVVGARGLAPLPRLLSDLKINLHHKFMAGIFVFMLAASVSGQAADGFAALLTVHQAGVEIQRLNTSQWLALPEEAQMPLGAGDSLRTDATGRALLTFGPDVEIFVLPETTLLVDRSNQLADERLQVALQVQGEITSHVPTAAAMDSFQIQTDTLTVTQPAALLDVWTGGDQGTVINVAEGEAEIRVGEQTFQVMASNGLRRRPSQPAEAIALDEPLNAARVIGLLDGCPGQTHTANGLDVNVRVGPGFSYTVIGHISNQVSVRIMGVVENGSWYRIQAFSGFGWIQAALVDNSCPQPLILPSDTMERNVGIWNVTPAEQALLLPFYGPPEGDLWFYRSLQPAS